MKKLTTIAKIGEAALTRLFNPHRICNAMEQSSCTVEFPKEEYNLDAPLSVGSSSSHYGNLQFNSGRGYMVWSIEIGRRGLKAQSGDTAFDAIARLDFSRQRIAPSHFIIRDWSSDDISGDSETYTVYRLSQKQEAEIKCYGWERVYAEDYRKVERIPSHASHPDGHLYCSEISRNGIEMNGSGMTEEEAVEDVIRNWCHLIIRPALV